jgi:hypothetical protein
MVLLKAQLCSALFLAKLIAFLSGWFGVVESSDPKLN